MSDPPNIIEPERQRLQAIWSFYLAHYIEPPVTIPEWTIWFIRHRTEVETLIRSAPIVATAVAMRSFLMAGGSLRLSALGSDPMATARAEAIRELDGLIFDYASRKGAMPAAEIELLTLGQEYQFLSNELAQLTIRRNIVIRRAHAQGMSLRSIAQLAQIDHTRVKQIIDAPPVGPLDGSGSMPEQG
jgi:hypothetical protein